MGSEQTITTTDKICPELIVVIGVGYVGLELVQTFSRYYKVIGYDISAERINYLKETYKNENVTFQTTLDGMRGAELYLISTTTLLDSHGNVDLKYVKAAIKNVLNLVTPYSTVCIESSVAVGTTRSLCLEFLEKKVYVGFSPERIDPGRTNIEAHAIPKVISGLTTGSLSRITELYSKVFDKLVPVSSCETAEMMKLYENCFRMINIAFVNEMSDNCVKFNIDPHEVVRAAASKPYGFMPFKPGIGVGGSCIPVNPYYLFANCDFPLLKMSTKLMEERPSKIAAQFQVKHGTNNHLLICGMAFKPGQSVCTYSQNITFAKCLSAKNHVEVYDPNVLVKDKELEWFEFNKDKQFARFDNILLLFGLDNFPRSFVKHLPIERVTFVTELC